MSNRHPASCWSQWVSSALPQGTRESPTLPWSRIEARFIVDVRKIPFVVPVLELGRDAGKERLVVFRLYGPLEPWFDETWQPGEFELLD